MRSRIVSEWWAYQPITLYNQSGTYKGQRLPHNGTSECASSRLKTIVTAPFQEQEEQVVSDMSV